MIRNLKLLLLAAMATLAVSAVAATGAQAEKEFHTWSSETVITSKADGTGKTSHHVIDAAGASLTCGGFKSEISMYGYKTLFWLTSRSVSYESCTFVGQTASVNMNGCNYEYLANGWFGIACPFGKEVQISVPSPVCNLTIPPQTNKGTISYTNINEKTAITVSTAVPSLKYTATGAGCPITGTYENGNYTTGNVIWNGEYESNGLATAVWIE